MKKLILILSSLIFLSSCTGYNTRAKLITINDDVNIVDYDASRRGAYIKKNNTIKICAEPSPDIAVAIANQFKFVKDDASLTLRLAESIDKIANRSNELELMREAMYRVCELSTNYTIDAAQAISLFEKIIAASYNFDIVRYNTALIKLGTTANKAKTTITNSNLDKEEKDAQIKSIQGFNIKELLLQIK